MKINKKKLIPILITAAGVLIAIFAGNNEKGGKLTDALGTVANLLGAEGASVPALPGREPKVRRLNCAANVNEVDAATLIKRLTILRKCVVLAIAIVAVSAFVGCKDKKETRENPLHILIAEGYTIMTNMSGEKMEATGDLNPDKYEDKIMALFRVGEEGDEMSQEDRVILLLLGQPDGTFALGARNDKLLWHTNSGGAMGRPLWKIGIENGSFSIQQQRGSRELYTQTETFKYSSKDKDWFLDKIVESDVDRIEPNSETEKTKTVKDFGRISFNQYGGE